MNAKFLTMLAIMAAAMVGCARMNSAENHEEPASVLPLSNTYILAEEPPAPMGVIEAKQSAKNGDEVVIVGKIGGSEKPFTGRAAFTVVDLSLKSCGDREGDTCLTPWDYCCEPREDLAKGTALVKFVDEKGKTLSQDAKSSMGLKELQTVVVRGIARRDESGFTIIAGGVFVRK